MARKLDHRLLPVLVYPSEQVPGQWIAVCLEINIVTQGNSLQHAQQMVLEAVLMTIEDDAAIGRDTFDPAWRRPAPSEDWLKYERILQQGRPLSQAYARKHQGRITGAAAAMLISRQVAYSEAGSRPPAPWMIKATEASDSVVAH